MANNSSVIRNCDVAAGGLEYIVLIVTMVILVMMVKYDDEEQDGLDLLSLADFDGERGGGGELGCQGGGHQGGEESKTEHSEQFQLLCSTIFRQWRTERSYQNTS